MNILFYDIVPTNIIRFFKDLVLELKEENIENRFFFLYEHDDGKSIKDVQSEYFFSQKIGYCQFKDINWFSHYMIENSIDVLFINGQRIADDRVVLAAKQNNVKTYMLQHGMYIPFLKRDSAFFLSKIRKTISYLYYAFDIGVHSGKNWSIVFDYIKSYIFGANQVDIDIDRSQLNVDHVFVYSQYWKDFHSKQFGYPHAKQSVVGTPDLRTMDLFLKTPAKPNEVCYIAQTLVEDGRLERTDQEAFFEKLVEATKNLNFSLKVKLHPRSDLTLYKWKEASHVEILEHDLPVSGVYIGHYSTLLAKPMMKKDIKVIIFEYENHPTPIYFKECSSQVINDIMKIQSSLISEKREVSDIERYFERGDEYTKKIVGFICNHDHNLK